MFPDGIGLFDESADLVTTIEGGRAVARALGTRPAVLLRNHGTLVVGKDLRWAVLTALTLERSLHMQTIAAGFGDPRPIPESVVGSLHLSKYRDSFMDEYWGYWLRILRAQGLAKGMPVRRARA
jgi:L-fuculose-phosphate aldolase